MKFIQRIFLFFFLFLLVLFKPLTAVIAQTDAVGNPSYQIEEFNDQITINKDTSVTVQETIKANFLVEKHGIIRVIPVRYSFNGKTINTHLKIFSIKDENGVSYPYTTSNLAQSIQLKIGDADKTLTGRKTYILTYSLKGIIQDYGDHLEFYWNVTGHEWNTQIAKSEAIVKSEFADITKVTCYAGTFGSQEAFCTGKYLANQAIFTSTQELGTDKDFSIVIALSKQNNFVLPGKVSQVLGFIADNWGYPVALIPFSFILFFWFKKGRDLKYVGDNIYYKPEKEVKETVGIFARKFLPMVYSPINTLTPSQVGTIIDQKVDTQDIIAEIVELGRLKYLTIEKLPKRGVFSKQDYAFVKTKDADSKKDKLRNYQLAIYEAVFDEDNLEEKDENKVLLSSLNKHFYLELSGIKRKLYDNLAESKIFEGSPDKVAGGWMGGFVGISTIIFVIIMAGFFPATYNSGPIILEILLFIPGILFAKAMPRRGPWGYSLFRQIVGLKHYLEISKWREEISEKKLFLEEMLPLAVALGVVDKLTKDMKDLGVTPPSYFRGFTTATFIHDFNYFSTRSASSFVSTPAGTHFSGSSSWSGGSGFGGGGFSGGGGGGGGGGSW